MTKQGDEKVVGRADTELLLARIDALQALLVVYRTNGRPTEGLFGRLDRTARSEARIRAELDVAGEVLA
jgi:hypothetical protein